MTRKFVAALAVVALVAGVSSAQKGTGPIGQLNYDTPATPSGTEACPVCIDIDLSGISFLGGPVAAASSEGFGFFLNVPVPAGALPKLSGVGWNYTFSTIGASWGSEATIGFADGATPPGPGTSNIYLTASGTTAPVMNQNVVNAGFPDPIKFAGIPLPDIALPSGSLRLEFFDTFTDNVNSPDATISQGILRLQFNVPEPGSFTLLAMAGLSLLGLRRRS